MSAIRTSAIVLLRSILLWAPLLFVIYLGGRNGSAELIGILFWVIVGLLGLPWNLALGALLVDFENKHAPGFFASLNQNHDNTVGLFMSIGAVSSYLNCLLVSLAVQFRTRSKKKSAEGDKE